MITKGVELEGQLSEFRTKDKQKDEVLQQLRNELSQKDTLLERNNEEILILRETHQTEIKRVSSQLDLSTEKLQKVQGDEMRQKQLQMRIDELQSDLERSERENAEKVCASLVSLFLILRFICLFFLSSESPHSRRTKQNGTPQGGANHIISPLRTARGPDSAQAPTTAPGLQGERTALLGRYLDPPFPL